MTSIFVKVENEIHSEEMIKGEEQIEDFAFDSDAPLQDPLKVEQKVPENIVINSISFLAILDPSLIHHRPI